MDRWTYASASDAVDVIERRGLTDEVIERIVDSTERPTP